MADTCFHGLTGGSCRHKWRYLISWDDSRTGGWPVHGPQLLGSGGPGGKVGGEHARAEVACCGSGPHSGGRRQSDRLSAWSKPAVRLKLKIQTLLYRKITFN